MEIRRKTKAEQLAAIREEQAVYDGIKRAIAELTSGAVSATISTAGGSQSYTRAQLPDLRALLRVSAARLDRLLARFQGRQSGPRRAYVSFD
jgi:hypothetical protein